MTTGDLYGDLKPERIQREIHGDSIVTRSVFKTGETVTETEIYHGDSTRETFIEIDGDIVFHGSWIYRDLEWRLTA